VFLSFLLLIVFCQIVIVLFIFVHSFKLKKNEKSENNIIIYTIYIILKHEHILFYYL